MRNSVILIFVLMICLLLAGCAAGPNAMQQPKADDNKPAGFLLGIWHGFISLFTFVISLFSDKVNVYEVYNNGGWYNFGFIIGISIFYGGGSKGMGRKRRRD